MLQALSGDVHDLIVGYAQRTVCLLSLVIDLMLVKTSVHENPMYVINSGEMKASQSLV